MAATCPVELSQFMACYNENPACPSGDNTCRVVQFVIDAVNTQHELVECASACRLKDNLFFAKTVSMKPNTELVFLLL